MFGMTLLHIKYLKSSVLNTRVGKSQQVRKMTRKLSELEHPTV